MGAIFKIFNTYLAPASDTLIDIGTPGLRFDSGYFRSLVSSNIVSCASANTHIATANSASITSERFVRSVGSSLVLSNSANAYMNVKMLTHNAASQASGDVFFWASSNRIYLGINSQGTTYFIAMDTL